MAEAAETVTVTRSINAPADRVWAMISDVTRMGEWSPELESAVWLGGASGPAPGAKFRGTNRNGKKSWKSVSTVVEAAPGRSFSFHVKAVGLDVADWGYSIEPAGAGCTVTEHWTDRRGALMRIMSGTATGVPDRASHNRRGMEQTLERLAAAAEAQAGGSAPS